ncbi:MAG: flagellar filament capping protein FliD [Natronospirillum sp.]
MASIQSLGIGSGLLTADLAEQIIAAEREATDKRLEFKTAKVEAQITAYGEIKSALSSLEAAAKSLASATNIRQTKSTSSNASAVTATTSSTAEVGNYSIAVDSIAQSHTVASPRYNSVTDTVGTGTLTFRFGTFDYDGSDNIQGFEQNSAGREFTLELDSTNNTLGGVRDAINAANMGVQASLVNDGTGYRLLLSSKEAGLDNAMEITVAGDAGLQALAYNQAQNDPNNNMLMTQKAADAELTVNGLAITSRSNQLTEVIRGVTINLNSATAGSTVNLNISRDTSGVVEKTEEFIEAYNFYREVYSEVTKFSPDDPQGGLLLGDSTLRTVQNQVRSALTQIVSGLENSQYRSLADIGIFTDSRDNYKLALNVDKLEEAFQNSIESVTGLFANRTVANDGLINYIAKSADTKPGEYAVEITQLATQAKMKGRPITEPTAGNPVIIGGSNDSFRINVDGTTATIDLTQGTYDNIDDLVLMIQNSINNNSTLLGRARSVTVGFNEATSSIEITSSRFGSSSQVSLVGADANIANTLGLTLPGQGGVSGQFYNTLNDLAFAASTIPGSREVFEKDSFNFASNTVSFDLILNGDAPVNITLDQDMSNVLDINGNVVEERTRNDTLSYINAQLNAAGLSGQVTAQFNSSNRLVFSSPIDAAPQTIELANVNVTGSNDVLGLESAQGQATSGVSIGAGVEFQLSYDNRYIEVNSGVVIVPEDIYETPEDLAAAIQAAINSDPTVAGAAVGAITTPGTRPIGTAINFDARPAGFTFEYNGQSFTVDVDADGTDNLDSVQTAIDNALVAGGLEEGDVKAINSAGGLALETLAKGSSEVLTMLSDGRGDMTTPGKSITSGIDFSADPANFTFRVDGVNIDVSLTEDLSAGTAEDTLAYIQQRLNIGLANAGGGGNFTAGDVVARLDENDQIVFETRSKNGARTNATFGALASLEVVSADAGAAASLGLAAAGPNILGRDAFGFELGSVQGFDSQSTVTYEKDEQGRGRFNISFDNSTNVSFAFVSNPATSQLGFSLSDGSENEVAMGKDVQGTINGIRATGNGQVLTAGSGAQAATNGYILGSPGFDFSTAVGLDSTSNTIRVTIDGVASGEINLTETAYATGRALADEMKRAINNDSALASAGKFVDVQYDPATNTFGIFSISTGEESTVRINSMDPALSAVTGLSPTSATTDGKNASGSKDPAAGIQLRVLGGQLGERGTVNYVSGVFEQLGSLFSGLLRTDGTVSTRIAGLDREMDLINEEKTRLETRIAAQEQRLKSQFLFNDLIISRLNSTESFLQQQFDIMNSMLSNKK